jgi:hypothetical protein
MGWAFSVLWVQNTHQQGTVAQAGWRGKPSTQWENNVPSHAEKKKPLSQKKNTEEMYIF